jgi:cell division protein FtsB
MVRRPTEPAASVRRNRRPREGAADGIEPASPTPSDSLPSAADEPVTDPIARPTLDGLTVAGFTRRRAAFLAGTFATIWIVAVFARQVGDASAATAKADQLRAQNAAAASDVAALQAELEQIQQAPYIAQQARAYDLGAPNERPFALAPGASPLSSDSPGSAALRLGGHVAVRSPLDTWLMVLFGPAPN